MSGVRDSFLDLERQRQRLKDQASQLRQSLGYWRTWDADYETLKEELNAIPEATRDSKSSLLAVKKGVESTIITAKELDVIFGGDNDTRTYDQIISVLDGRIDTGSKNVTSLERGLESTENKLAATTVIMNPDATDEEGQPFTDIIEELDDDDNVISYRLAKPGDNSLQIRELLEKAGVKNLPSSGDNSGKESGSGPSSSKAASQATINKGEPPQTSDTASKKALTMQPKLIKQEIQNTLSQPEPPSSKSVVAFTNDTKSESKSETPGPLSRAAQRVQNIMDTAKAQEQISKKDPKIPENESDEDAQLRRDMLKYGLGEVGAVVAEMFIDEENDEEDWGSDPDYESDESDDFGQSKYSVISDDYRQKMLELEKKLGFQSQFARQLEEKIASEPDDAEERPGDEGIGRIVVQKEGNRSPSATSTATMASGASPATPTASDDPGTSDTTSTPATKTAETTATTSKLKKSEPNESAKSNADKAESANCEAEPKSAKKSVRFAEMLDIAPQKPGGKSTPRRAKLPKVTDDDVPDTITDVVERNTSSNNRRKKGGKKASRFKKAMASETQGSSTPARTPDAIPAVFSLDENKISGSAAEPVPPKGETLAATVVERPTPASDKVVINDDFDELTLQQEVADEYHKRRKNMIQQHGGFLVEEELPIQRVEEEENTKRVSRFKAARLSKQ
ncbi:hypothetical protein BROUX41_000161 [Berkeleyomyces rouxiae]|uniref:uncharacterized protein n=1 Tax=Berkeleyomyces rouxiae TaxID=2035830 RepID=UPI003B787ECD